MAINHLGSVRHSIDVQVKGEGSTGKVFVVIGVIRLICLLPSHSGSLLVRQTYKLGANPRGEWPPGVSSQWQPQTQHSVVY